MLCEIKVNVKFGHLQSKNLKEKPKSICIEIEEKVCLMAAKKPLQNELNRQMVDDKKSGL